VFEQSQWTCEQELDPPLLSPPSGAVMPLPHGQLDEGMEIDEDEIGGPTTSTSDPEVGFPRAWIWAMT
jgi:hypothetical protein